jgi:Zn-dependent peptidase ImmA (M78 family)/DNA-binding XRE family transcriptional regulator
MFNPSRLTLARERRGLAQIQLAKLINVTRLTIYRYESGEGDPPPDKLLALSRALNFPEEFFSGAHIDPPNELAPSFRSLTAMTARERKAAIAAGAISFLLDDWVRSYVARLPPVSLDDFSGETPEIAARTLRQRWAFGERPIKNMIHLLEAKGVRVFSLVEETRSLDAFSLWRDDSPYVFLNTQKTGERSRFDAAHELGHLVLHRLGGPRGGGNDGKEAEYEANRFASAFLMPEADVMAVAPTVSNVQQIIYLKRRWSVAATALNYRLHKLGSITDWQYHKFAIQLTEMGFRTGEPGGIAPEKSAYWQKVLDGLRTRGINKNSMSAALALPVGEVENLLFGLASMTTLEGGGTGTGKSRANLRVISN